MNDTFNPVLLSSAYFLIGDDMRDYYSSLPAEIRLAIDEHADEIRSEADLRRLAEKMMKKR